MPPKEPTVVCVVAAVYSTLIWHTTKPGERWPLKRARGQVGKNKQLVLKIRSVKVDVRGFSSMAGREWSLIKSPKEPTVMNN